MRLSQKYRGHFVGISLLWAAVPLLVCELCLAQSKTSETVTLPIPRRSVPNELLNAYVLGVTKKGSELGKALWCNQTGWVVVSLSQVDRTGHNETFPMGIHTPRPPSGYVAIHLSSNKLRYFPSVTTCNEIWELMPDDFLALSGDDLYFAIHSSRDMNSKKKLLCKWTLSSDTASIIGNWNRPTFQFDSLLKALEETRFHLEWPKDIDFEKIRRCGIRYGKGVESIGLPQQDVHCDWPSLPHGEIFLPGSTEKEIVNVQESASCDGPMIRCLELDAPVKVKWEIDPKRLAEICGKSEPFPNIGVPFGLQRPCHRIPLMIGNVLKGEIWFLDTATGELAKGWSHPTFKVPLAPRFGIVSPDGKVLAVPNKNRFYVFQSNTGEVVYDPKAAGRDLQPVGIDQNGKVIAVSDDGIWALFPPYKEPPIALFRLRLPMGFQ